MLTFAGWKVSGKAKMVVMSFSLFLFLRCFLFRGFSRVT